MYFYKAGLPFFPEEQTSISWQIGALLMRYSEIEETEPCPLYFAHNPHTYIQISVEDNAPTVELCVRVVKELDLLMEKWMEKEIKVQFGTGDPAGPEPQGVLQVGLTANWRPGGGEKRID